LERLAHIVKRKKRRWAGESERAREVNYICPVSVIPQCSTQQSRQATRDASDVGECGCNLNPVNYQPHLALFGQLIQRHRNNSQGVRICPDFGIVNICDPPPFLLCPPSQSFVLHILPSHHLYLFPH
jgi:hypothetical protein